MGVSGMKSICPGEVLVLGHIHNNLDSHKELLLGGALGYIQGIYEHELS